MLVAITAAGSASNAFRLLSAPPSRKRQLMCVFASRVPDSSGRRLHAVQLRVWRGTASPPTTALQVAAFRLVAGRYAARSSRARRALRRCCAICRAVAARCKP